MRIESFDPEHSHDKLSLKPEEIARTVPDNKRFPRGFSSHPIFLQKMGKRQDGLLGHINMHDMSYEQRRPQSTTEICTWAREKLLIITQTQDFVLVSHQTVIQDCIEQVQAIMRGELNGLRDHYSTDDEYAGFWQLDNNYFFSTEPDNGVKFYEYITR